VGSAFGNVDLLQADTVSVLQTRPELSVAESVTEQKEGLALGRSTLS